MIVENWFSTPILYYEIEKDLVDKIQSEIDSAIPNITKGDLSNPWGDNVDTSFKYNDTTTNDIQTYNLKSLEEVIIKAKNKMLPDIDLVIKESWTNFSRNGNFQFDHSHSGKSNFILSGTYYYKTNGDDGDIEFISPVPSQFNFAFSSPAIKHKPKVGKLLLFPSWLTHRVNLNKTDNLRISISFNLSESPKWSNFF
jgi:uncharacterized protein (TIGR02466 family)